MSVSQRRLRSRAACRMPHAACAPLSTNLFSLCAFFQHICLFATHKFEVDFHFWQELKCIFHQLRSQALSLLLCLSLLHTLAQISQNVHSALSLSSFATANATAYKLPHPTQPPSLSLSLPQRCFSDCFNRRSTFQSQQTTTIVFFSLQLNNQLFKLLFFLFAFLLFA